MPESWRWWATGHPPPLPWDSAAGFGRYPIALYRFADGFYVAGADPTYAQLVGGKVVSIAGRPVDEMYAAVTPLISRDPGNRMWYQLYAGAYMATPEVLEALGLVPKGGRATMVVQRNGREVAAELARGGRPSATSQNGWVTGGGWVTMHDSLKAPGPLWTRRPDDGFWLQYLPAARALYVQYNAVQDGDKETVAHFFGRACADVTRRHADRMILDLRLNGGGDNTLNAEVVKTIMRTAPINRRGHLFVIIGRNTFSAAQNFVNSLERYTDAIFVGEPTGANPNQYGDAVPVRLRHSGVVLYVSTLWWQDLDSRDRREWTAPEIAAEMTSADFAPAAIRRSRPRSAGGPSPIWPTGCLWLSGRATPPWPSGGIAGTAMILATRTPTRTACSRKRRDEPRPRGG